jgi:hypothetical protein
MASPIQIILNDKDYEEKRDAGGGGPKKDFFAHQDTEFRAHKKKLISQLETLSKTIASQTQGHLAARGVGKITPANNLPLQFKTSPTGRGWRSGGDVFRGASTQSRRPSQGDFIR